MITAQQQTRALEVETDTTSTTAFKPRRGRPSLLQVKAIDSAILDAARAMFLETGYANTTMEAVAASVGVSKGTLYSRYPNKTDLFRAIVDDRLAAWSTEIPPPQAGGGSTVSEELFRSGVSFLNSMLVPEVAAFDHMILSEAGRFPELSRVFHDQGYVPFVEDLSQRIVAAAGDWPVGDARSVAVGFIAVMLGWFRMERMLGGPNETTIASFVARQVAVIVGGRAAW